MHSPTFESVSDVTTYFEQSLAKTRALLDQQLKCSCCGHRPPARDLQFQKTFSVRSASSKKKKDVPDVAA